MAPCLEFSIIWKLVSPCRPSGAARVLAVSFYKGGNKKEAGKCHPYNRSARFAGHDLCGDGLLCAARHGGAQQIFITARSVGWSVINCLFKLCFGHDFLLVVFSAPPEL